MVGGSAGILAPVMQMHESGGETERERERAKEGRGEGEKSVLGDFVLSVLCNGYLGGAPELLHSLPLKISLFL